MVDATQGVEAQTLANVYLALDHDLEIIPVINKIDLPSADVAGRAPGDRGGHRPRRLRRGALPRAKEGIGIEEILEQVVQQGPAARRATRTAPLKAIIFDSWYDTYRGVVMLVRVFEGTLAPRAADPALVATGKEFEVQELGVFAPFSPAGAAAHGRRGGRRASPT